MDVCRETSHLPEIVAQALDQAAIQGRKFSVFSRLKKGSSVYTAQSYSRSVKYDKSCAMYTVGDSTIVGLIHSFVKVHNCMCLFENVCECFAPSIAIIRRCHLLPFLPLHLLDGISDVIHECTGVEDQAIAINVEQLVTVCFFFLKIRQTETERAREGEREKKYIALPTNMIEVE